MKNVKKDLKAFLIQAMVQTVALLAFHTRENHSLDHQNIFLCDYNI